MIDRDKTISALKEISDYFHECRGNASFGSKAEEHFWELQSAARDAAVMLNDGAFVMTDEAAIEQLRSSGWMQNHDREMSRPCWISVKDRLPEKFGQYLCWFGGNKCAVGAEVETYLPDMHGFGSFERYEVYPNISHWMPLPEVPKDGEV